MKIIINLMPLGECNIEECKDNLKSRIMYFLDKQISYHLKDHIHSIEVLDD